MEADFRTTAKKQGDEQTPENKIISADETADFKEDETAKKA